MLFISPPFGNYIHLPYTTSIKGSFTYEPRSGLISQIFKTLRYSHKYNGWVNKIGLRNPGIEYAIQKYNYKKDIISIAILKTSDIPNIIKILPEDANIELNISCPNINKPLIYKNIEKFIHPSRKWCIVKLSPIVDTEIINILYYKGFRQFHCSNTIPVPEGGLSGKKIIQYNVNLIKYINDHYDDAIIIAGGGIYNYETFEKYKSLNVSNFSISSLFFSPFKCINFYIQYIIKNEL